MPGFDIISQLQNASNAFRTYIEEGLAEVCIIFLWLSLFSGISKSIVVLIVILQIEKNAAAGKTLSSVPMSMPPPVALNLISFD